MDSRSWANESSSTSSSSITSNSNNNNNSNSSMFLKQANKNSHKISKPIRKSLPLPTPIQPIEPTPQFPPPGRGPPQSQQPAVYNINKNDFRDVVQKLTGSPAHDRQQTPPPPQTHPRPPSSRLQRIRPPPLSQIGNRPAQISQIHHHRPQFEPAGQRSPHAQPFPHPHPASESPVSAYMRFLQNPPSPSPHWNGGQRPPPPPAFSTLHPPAESPISAYMRFLQTSASPRAPSPMWNAGPRPDMPQNEFGQRLPPPPFSPLQPVVSPASSYTRFLQSSGAQPPQQQPQFVLPPQPLTPIGAFPSPFPAMPLSPLPFGCIPSPRSPYGMMSPGFLFAPMGHHLGFPQLPPLSPTFPVPSPRWKGM